MKFGLSASQYQFIEQEVVSPLRALGATLWCFGSRARGDHSPYSDLDIMVEADNDLSRPIADIQETLQESNFPFKVDIVRLDDFAESYRSSYERDKVRVI